MKHLDDASATPPLESIGVTETLRECVTRRSLALVLDLETERVSKAEFVAFSGERITLDTFHDKSDSYPVASLCAVAFVYGDCFYVFLAGVLGFHERPGPEPSQLELEVPLQIAASKGRIRYRVPVFKDAGLEIHVIIAGHRPLRAQALNLSLTGILIEFAEVTDPHLPVGAGLHLTFGLGDQGVSLEGEVVRTHGHQYGIAFRDAGGAVIPDPPEPLGRIVRMLERRWLRERIRTADQNAKGQAGGAQNVHPDRGIGQKP
jgi:hypothetical protein